MTGKTTEEESLGGKPCWHMRALISSLSDGKLSGLARRYTEWHTANCAHCSGALASLTVLQVRLYTMGGADTPTAGPEAESLHLTPDRRAKVQEAWAKMDQEAGNR